MRKKMGFFDEWNEGYLHIEEDGNERTSSKHLPIHHHHKEVARHVDAPFCFNFPF